MQPLPPFVAGVSVEDDLRTGTWRLRFGGHSMNLREWTWAERRRLVHVATAKGTVDADIFIDGLFHLLADSAPDRDWRTSIAIVCLKLLGVPEEGATDTLRRSELAVARAFGWLPSDLDRQSASAVDALLAQIESGADSAGPAAGDPADEGWNRILVASAHDDAPSRRAGDVPANAQTPVGHRLERYLSTVAAWAGLRSTQFLATAPGSLKAPVAAASASDPRSTSQGRGDPAPAPTPTGGTPPRWPTQTPTAKLEQLAAFPGTATAGLPGTARLRPLRQGVAPVRAARPRARKNPPELSVAEDSEKADSTAPSPLPEFAGASSEFDRLRGRTATPPKIASSSSADPSGPIGHAANEASFDPPVVRVPGSVWKKSTGPGPRRAESQGTDFRRKPVGWAGVTALARIGGEPGDSTVSRESPRLPFSRSRSRPGSGPTWEEPGPLTGVDTSDIQHTARTNPTPEDPFESGVLEEQLADVLERVAREGGIDVP